MDESELEEIMDLANPKYPEPLDRVNALWALRDSGAIAHAAAYEYARMMIDQARAVAKVRETLLK